MKRLLLAALAGWISATGSAPAADRALRLASVPAMPDLTRSLAARKDISRAPLAGVALSPWGRELLGRLDPTPSGTSEFALREGWTLRTRYDDIPGRGRANTEAVASTKRCDLIVDRRLRGTEAEQAALIHELTHVEDVVAQPNVRPEDFGLLMEWKANLYEIAAYIERHPDIRHSAAPRNFFEMETWFKARVYAGRLDASFARQVEKTGLSEDAARLARVIVEDCRGKAACGGTEALMRRVIFPPYAGTTEGNILDRPRAGLGDRERAELGRALAYRASLEDLDRRIRARFGL